VQILNKEDNKV